MDDEAKQLLREIRDLIGASNKEQSSYLAQSRELQQEAIGYNRKVWRLSLILVLAIPIVAAIAYAIGYVVELYYPVTPPAANQDAIRNAAQ